MNYVLTVISFFLLLISGEAYGMKEFTQDALFKRLEELWPKVTPALKVAFEKREQDKEKYGRIIEDLCKKITERVAQGFGKSDDELAKETIRKAINQELERMFGSQPPMPSAPREEKKNLKRPHEDIVSLSELASIELSPMAHKEEKQRKIEGEPKAQALFDAIRAHDSEMVTALLLSGEDVNSQDNDGCTPLIRACALGFESIVHTLIFEGKADASLLDHKGNSALIWAVAKGHTAIVRMLLEYYHMNVNGRNKAGTPLLIIAAHNGHFGVVKVLLEFHADIFVCDKWGNTPMHAAAASGDISILQCFLELGLPHSTRNYEGETPLDIALKKLDKNDPLLLAANLLNGK